MFGSYFKIALRALSKNKIYSLINLLGLAIGMACFILIFLFVQDELSYDKFHKNGNRIYRIAGEYDQGGDIRNRSALTTYIMKDWLDVSFPDIEHVVRLGTGNSLVKYGAKMFQESGFLFVDGNFLEVFSFQLIKGESATALAQPNTMVITEAMAKKYFGDDDPLGKMLDLDGPLVKVTGVMKEMPHNSHFHADFVVSMKTIEPFYPKWILTNATGTSHYTYVQLHEGVESTEIEAQIADYLVTKEKEFAESRNYFLQPLADIHLLSNLSSEIEANGDILYVYILLAVAFIILFMACINYMNLEVARSVNRAKEVGIRKVVGARRKQLVQQFLGESILTALLALVLSIFLVEIFIPIFNELAGKQLQLNLMQNLMFLAGLVSLSLLVGGLAGSYPAVFLSAFQSVSILKGKFTRVGRKSLNMRKSLVVIQFTMSVALLVSTLVIYNQLTFMRQKKLGINPEQVLIIPFQADEIRAQFEQIKTELLRNPDIINVSTTNNRLTSRVSSWREYKIESLEEKVMIPTVVVGHDFFKTMESEILDGRDFSRDFLTDIMGAYILNESAVKFLGLESPVGTSITGAIFTGSQWSKKDARIIGIVNDFHFASLHTEIQPTAFSLYSEKTTSLRVMAVRMNGGNIPKTLDFIENTWKKYASGRPILTTFMDESINSLYQAEERFLKIFLAFAGLAIVVTCLGLLGLSAYAAAQRTKEIGIRKTLGASILKIVGLLSIEFLKLVAISNIIAWPIAYFVMDKWLQDFAYRIEIGFWTFLAAAALALAIAMITISFQTIRAALTNPVNALKYE